MQSWLLYNPKPYLSYFLWMSHAIFTCSTGRSACPDILWLLNKLTGREYSARPITKKETFSKSQNCSFQPSQCHRTSNFGTDQKMQRRTCNIILLIMCASVLQGIHDCFCRILTPWTLQLQNFSVHEGAYHKAKLLKSNRGGLQKTRTCTTGSRPR